MIYSSRNKECDRLKLVIMCHFLPFNLKNQNLKKKKKKKKKTPGDIIILQLCITNHNHIMYGS